MDEAEGTLEDLQIGRGTLVGRYVVLSQLGRGGMGTVYSALDPDLDRRVALKVVEPRANERRSDLSREARVLARLEHPNVATVYDVGFWNECLFIAMELVDGGDLEHWLRQPHKPGEILTVFMQAGRGLAAAHARGVVHRDFKPSNVLMGADGRVRVADFGLARLSRETLATVRAGDSMRALVDSEVSVAGTPDFMAPEVTAGGAATVLSDQYSFCVALNGALPGSLPAAARRAIARGLLPKPRDRFESMDELLRTLEQAGRRRRVLLAGGAAIMAAGSALAMAAFSDTRDCRAAIGSWSEVHGAERRAALRQSLASSDASYAEDSARRVVGALGRFGQSWSAAFEGVCGDPARTTEVRCLERQRDRHDALWVALEQGGPRFVEHALPAVSQLPRPDECIAAESSYRAPLAPAEPDDVVAGSRIRARLLAAEALAETGQMAASLLEATRALKLAETLEHPPLVAEALLAIGVAQQVQGDSAAARLTLRRAATTAWASGHDEAMLTVLSHLVVVVGRELGDEATGEIWSELGHASVARLGWPSAAEAEFLNAAGVLAASRGQWSRARRLYERSLETRRRLLHEDHPHIIQSISNLATVDLEQGKFDSALARSREAVTHLLSIYGEGHPNVALGRGVLGLALVRKDRIDEASAELERALEDARAGLGPSHPRVASIANNLGLVLDRRREFARSKALYLEALAAWSHARGDDDPQVGVAHFNAANAASRLGDHDEAIEHMQAALRIWTNALGEDHPRVASALRGLSGVLRAAGRCEEAVMHAERALAVLGRAREASSPQTRSMVLFSLGRARLCHDDLHGAEAATAEALELARTTYGKHSLVRRMLTHLAEIMLQQDRLAEARAAIDEALTIDGEAAEIAESKSVLTRIVAASEAPLDVSR